MIYSNFDTINVTDMGFLFNPFASPGEEVSGFTYPYLSAGDPALGEVKGLMNVIN